MATSAAIDYGPYNRPSSVILIGSYPRRSDRNIHDLNAVASYVDHLTPSLKTQLAGANRRLIILTQVVENEAPAYEEDQVLALRCWRRNSPLCFWQILRAMTGRLGRVERVLIQFEFNMFGGMATTGMLPAFLLVLRLLGKKTAIMVHQVVEDLAEIQEHVGLRNRRLRLGLLCLLLKGFYWLLLVTARHVAVHDEVLRDRMASITRRPVAVIPHGSGEYKSLCDPIEARRRLGFGEEEFVLLCFGFLAHYKGSDWIAREVAAHAKECPETPLRLLLAGGESPNHKGKSHYTQFIAQVLTAAGQCPSHIQVTGYLPDDRVPLYFTAADVAVFPYRTQIAASGPLAIALSFGCPPLISKGLRGAIASQDFYRALKENRLSIEDITFDLMPGQLVRKGIALSRDTNRLKAMRRMALSVAAARSWSGVAKEYVKLIDTGDARHDRSM
jgi:glycosyltransferase involved in cell wall biosynthesis